MKGQKSYALVYHEASRLEERIGCYAEAKKICDLGFNENEDYSPLWFQYLKVSEKAGLLSKRDLTDLHRDFKYKFAKELQWKFALDIAEIF